MCFTLKPDSFRWARAAGMSSKSVSKVLLVDFAFVFRTTDPIGPAWCIVASPKCTMQHICISLNLARYCLVASFLNMQAMQALECLSQKVLGWLKPRSARFTEKPSTGCIS